MSSVHRYPAFFIIWFVGIAAIFLIMALLVTIFGTADLIGEAIRLWESGLVEWAFSILITAIPMIVFIDLIIILPVTTMLFAYPNLEVREQGLLVTSFTGKRDFISYQSIQIREPFFAGDMLFVVKSSQLSRWYFLSGLMSWSGGRAFWVGRSISNYYKLRRQLKLKSENF